MSILEILETNAITALKIIEALLAAYGGIRIVQGITKTSRTKKPTANNLIVRIYLHGPIREESSTQPFLQKREITPGSFKKKVDSALDDKVKGIIFDINSPGGSVVPSKKIADCILELKVPTVALITEYATSGAYWIASACNKIVANELSTVGSIGVILPHFNISELAKKHGIEYDGIKSGEYKDAGNIFRQFTESERKILQEQIDFIHDKFIKAIASNRKMNESAIREIANGLAYHGEKAAEYGLVDKLGGITTAIKLIEEAGQFQNGIPREYDTDKQGFLSSLFQSIGIYSTMIGKCFGTGVYQAVEQQILQDKNSRTPE